MNNLLGIKLAFNHEPNYAKPGAKNLKKANIVSIEKIEKLISDLQRVQEFYSGGDKIVNDALIDVYYNDIIPKSGRIQEILKQKGDCNNSIVGARFTDASEGNENHIITHYVSTTVIDEAIGKLLAAKEFIEKELGGEANSENFNADSTQIKYPKSPFNKTKIRNIIIDSSVVEAFGIPNAGAIDDPKDQMIITFYKTELGMDDLFDRVGMDRYKYWYDSAGENTISASLEAYRFLSDKVPYLISMVASDISLIDVQEFKGAVKKDDRSIPSPYNEPTIGVIDTLFDENVYFSEWVDYRETLDFFESQKIIDDYYEHGTAVSSLIVDGPTLNPWLDDGLGRFRVRHFGVCPGRIHPTKLIRKIEKIINENQDIHIWNLSLGTDDEISKNFISFDAAALDKIQQEKNVIFIIAGTNDTRDDKNGTIRIGSPADSLNAVVVNSVKRNGRPASYTRNGKVLSFYNKPDVSYYGGDFEDTERINVYTNKGSDRQYGTSFAAPWISRKMCYLIDVLGMSREVAKALVIDAAAGWEYKQETYKYQNVIGYGIVPIKARDIVHCDNSEIRFVLQGVANSYTTSNYGLPIPKDENGKCPYIARAALCYFPECSRVEGVDYTQRELSLRLGRMHGKNIEDINHNIQDSEGKFANERRARKEFRKWENTKFVSSLYKEKGLRALNSYDEGLWGVSLTSKERRRSAKQNDLSFGLVVTVKNIKGVNKINDFKHACLLRGYIVNEIDIKSKIDIYEKAQEEIQFE